MPGKNLVRLATGREVLVAGIWLLMGFSTARVNAESVLFAFTHGGKPNDAVELRSVEVTPAKLDSGMALHVDGVDDAAWAGIILKAPHGRWNLSEHDGLMLDVRNVGPTEITIVCRVENADADPPLLHCNAGQVTLAPGANGILSVAFKRSAFSLAGIPMFGMHGFPPPDSGDDTIDPAMVARVAILVPKPQKNFSFEIGDVRLSGLKVSVEKQPDSLRSIFPFIDTFGQYMHADWPNKTHTLGDLKERRAAEVEELSEWRGAKSWDKYGGWKTGPLLLGTGFFRTAKYRGKWWLVDPDGRLFFSNGIDCIWPGETTPLQDRSTWFQDFPGSQPDYKEFLSVSDSQWGHYLDTKPACYDFAGANLKRKYGANWQGSFAEVTQERLRSWGLNTIGNWSDPAIYSQQRTPYVTAVHFASKPLEGARGYWGRFRDVFDPDFGRELRASVANQASATANDPWCMGYFIDNELGWGADTSLALATIDSPPYQAAKQVLVADLMAKYHAVEKLNNVWGTNYKSWGDIIESRDMPDKTRAHDDLVAFYKHTARQYFKLCREAVRKTAPNHLYLGCRFSGSNPAVVETAAHYCDVLSYNIYRRSVADLRLPANVDVPVMIGEFHFGATDRGQFYPGLVRVKDQAERAIAYKEFVTDALRHPNIVGCHWFSYRDEPTTGRTLDGENYQNGFVDVTDTPYTETIQAAREIGYHLYEIRSASEPARKQVASTR
jgi:hypothetical protein